MPKGHKAAETEQVIKQMDSKLLNSSRLEKMLMKRAADIEGLTRQLEDVRTALDVLLKKRDEDKKNIEKKVLANIKEIVFPCIEELKNSQLKPAQKSIVNTLEENLDNVISPFICRLSSNFFNFTTMELRVAYLVKEGKGNKEISDILCVSINTVLTHRSNIRRKLGLIRKKINLRSHLISLDN